MCYSPDDKLHVKTRRRAYNFQENQIRLDGTSRCMGYPSPRARQEGPSSAVVGVKDGPRYPGERQRKAGTLCPTTILTSTLAARPATKTAGGNSIFSAFCTARKRQCSRAAARLKGLWTEKPTRRTRSSNGHRKFSGTRLGKYLSSRRLHRSHQPAMQAGFLLR